MKTKIKIGFVGLGSIAKRHIKNVVTVLNNRECSYEIDIIRSLNKENDSEIDKFVSQYYIGYDNVPGGYDVLFITNPTEMHEETIRKFSSHTKNMFIEKPLFSSSKVEIDRLGLNQQGIYYVACPLRYKKVIQYVKEKIDLSEIIGVRAISSSYLPDWRPGQRYQDTYSARKQLGGGVGIDLIHEWDYLIYLFGPPTTVFTINSKKSNLEIDSDDIAVYIGENENQTFELHLDYYGRKLLREFEIFTNEETIKVDLVGNTISGGNKKIQFIEDRNDFQYREIEYFFKIILDGKENTNDIKTALTTLKITKGETF